MQASRRQAAEVLASRVSRWRPVPPARCLQHASAELLHGGAGEGQSESWRVLQRQDAILDLRRILEQLGLQRVALGIREGFDDVARRASPDDVGVDEAVVVGGDLDVVEIAQGGQLAALDKPALPRFRRTSLVRSRAATAGAGRLRARAGRHRAERAPRPGARRVACRCRSPLRRSLPQCGGCAECRRD